MGEVRCGVKLVIYGKDKFFGPGVAQLLEKVDESNSLSKACAQMNLAYTKALRMVKNAERELGVKLLDRKIGGPHGGGSRLTPRAKKVLELYRTFEQNVKSDTDVHFEQFMRQLMQI